MALTKCFECGNDISDKASFCPKCGKKVVTQTVIMCPECGNKFESDICPICGYNINKVENIKKQNKRKKTITNICVISAIVLVLVLIFIVSINKANKHIIDACKELAEAEGKLPNIEAIYISEDVSDDTTIDYVYRVYIEYESRWETNTVMYIVDDEGESYYITEYSKNFSNYLEVAELEIFGYGDLLGPSDNWEELSTSDIEKIKDRID